MLYQADNLLMSAALKKLAVDQVQQANSGHPGMPMGFSDVATVLWSRVLRFDPSQPRWFDRDRFILSNGHGSALHYALLHLTGHPLSLDDCRNFRQIYSPTPGHPERDPDIGIEVTTGPLGQGLANACGIMMAQKHLNARLNDCLTFKTYVVVGDGCLMEGISHEAASMAAAWSLKGLVALWDDNQITIDGAVSLTSKEDTLARFRSYGWHVIGPVDGHDFAAIAEAFEQADQVTDKPVLIDFNTVIGEGSSVAGMAKAHGAPLSEEDHQNILSGSEMFDIDSKALTLWRRCGTKATQIDDLNLDDSQRALLEECITGKKPTGWFDQVSEWMHTDAALAAEATRVSSKKVLSNLAPHWGVLVGGSADLASSVGSQWGTDDFSDKNPKGRHINFGIREFAMFAAASGIATVGLTPYVSTFLVFSDYGRNAMRVAAMMHLRVIYVLTHDSIALGEDGPTHQPIEHLTMLRATPGLEVWRPANGLECAVAWQQACERQGPSVLVLSRQAVGELPRPVSGDLSEGAAVLVAHPTPRMTIVATGSEVTLAYQASKLLSEKGIHVRVVTVPCLDRLKERKDRQKILGQAPIFVVEAGSSLSWGDIQPDPNYRLTVDQYGHSGKSEHLQKHFGMHAGHLAERIESLIVA